MHPFAKTLIFCLISITCYAAVKQPDTDADLLEKYTLAELETRLTELDTELNQLARFTPRSGAGSIGWLSKSRKDSTHPEWAEINLASISQIDQIVLVPVLWTDGEKRLQADGFPKAFEVIVGAEGETEGEVIARFGPEDYLLPRVAPLVIDIPPTKASWVRIQSTQLSRSIKKGTYVFCLSEIMIFSGEHNVALTRSARVSSTTREWGGVAISPNALTDGFTPFLMNASQGKSSKPYLARFEARRKFWLRIDLGANYPVEEIRLHSASDIKTPIPLPQQVDYGIPKHLIVEGANEADFSDTVTLLDYRNDTIHGSDPTLVRNVPETRCRYIRLSVPEPYKAPWMPENRRFVHLSELEIIARGQNVAKGKKVITPRWITAQQFKESITDGSNSLGEILAPRDWMEQLARRHDLERVRPLVKAALNDGYARQKTNLQRMYWLATLLAAGIAFTILINLILRQRTVIRTRERIAANLHDELGANLHAIGLLGDIAKKIVDRKNAAAEWSDLSDVVDEVRALTEETGQTARYCTNMLEAKVSHGDLAEEIKRTAARLLTDTGHSLSISNAEQLQKLKPRKRVDLFLFYKECLTNILRHASATLVETRIAADRNRITLTITDNGQGMDSEEPASLKRRARLLGARLRTETPETGGTRITLTLKTRKWKLVQ